jgi:predicted alpha/beta-hydrolase family hydrolase
MAEVVELRFVATESSGPVSALWHRPEDARAAYVFGHGAGAGMRHAFMEGVAKRLGRAGIATFRYQFPYMESGRKAPDRAPVLVKTVRSAVAEAGRLAGDLPLFAGGKSMGGRMTSAAAAEEALPRVQGLAFLGFPLHPPGRSGTERPTLHVAEGADHGFHVLKRSGRTDTQVLDEIRASLAQWVDEALS